MRVHLSKKFILEQSINALIQGIRKSKQKTKKISNFEAHFGRRCNTPISNITTKSNKKNLNYKEIIKFYLDEDKISGRLYFTDAQ